MGFGHGGPAAASLAALQLRRLQDIRSNDQELERESASAADSGVPHHEELPAWVQLGNDTGGQQQGYQQQGQAARLQRGSNLLSARVWRSVLLQELHPTRLALGQLAAAASLQAKQPTSQPTSTAAHGNLTSAAANRDTTMTSQSPRASYAPDTRRLLPWARLAIAAHDAQRAAAWSGKAQRERDGGDELLESGLMSDTDDEFEGCSSSGEGEGSGSGGGDDGGVLDPLAVAGALLDDSVEQRLVVHSMLWGAEAPDGAWSALKEALAPAAMVQAIRREMDPRKEMAPAAPASTDSVAEPMNHVGAAQQGEQRHGGMQQQAWSYVAHQVIDHLECAQSLHAMLSDAAHSMRGADPRVHQRAVAMGLSYAEEYVERSRRAHVAWPVGDPRGKEQGLAGGLGTGGSAGAHGSEADELAHHAREREQQLAQRWSEVQAARGNGRRLVGWLEEGRYGELLPGVLPGDAGSQHGGWAQGGDMAGGVVGFVEATTWLKLAQLAAVGRPDAVEVLYRALLGLLLIHRAHRKPADLLQPPKGSCHPCNLANFHIAYEAMCATTRHSHIQRSEANSSSSSSGSSGELPPLAVLYNAVAYVAPECLVLAMSPRPAFQPPEQNVTIPFPPHGPEHLGLVVKALLDQPLMATCICAHHYAWRVAKMVARAGAASSSAGAGDNANLVHGSDGRPYAVHDSPPADAPPHRPWARGPVDRVAKMWRRCLAIASAEEVLRAGRQGGFQDPHRSERQQQQSEGLRQPPPPPRPIEVGDIHVTYDAILQLYDRLQRRWTCGVLSPGTVSAAALDGVRATVRRLAELGLLEEPGAGAGLPAAEVHERISEVSMLLRECMASPRLLCSRPAAGSEASSESVMTHLLAAHVSMFGQVSLPDELLKAEHAVGAGGLADLRARLAELRRAPNRAPVRAKELMQLAREVNIAVLAAHPDTWRAALQQLVDLERQQESEHQGVLEGRQGVAGVQGDQEAQRRARDAKADALRAVLIDGLLGLAAVMERGPPAEHLGLALCATVGTLAAQVWDHLRTAPNPSERNALELQLRLLPELLAHLLSSVPHELCSFALRELGNPMAPKEEAQPGTTDIADIGPGRGAVRQPPLPEPARRLAEMYDSYTRLVLYDMGCACGTLATCKALLVEGGGGGRCGPRGSGGASSGLTEEALERLGNYGYALVAASSTNFRAFASRELLRLRAEGGPCEAARERHAGASEYGGAAEEAGARGSGVMRRRPTAAGPPEPLNAMRGDDGRRGRGSSSDVEGTEVVGHNPMSEWFVLDSGWGVQPGEEANLVTALLMARAMPGMPSGCARLRLHGPEAAMLLMLCIKESEKVKHEEERYMLLPSLPAQGQGGQPKCQAGGKPGPAAAAEAVVAAADSSVVCVEVRLGRPPLLGVSELSVKYDWAAIHRAVIPVRESSSEPKILSALRAPFLSPAQRLGAVYVEGDGVVGSIRALHLVAKVREELNKQGREIAVLVEAVNAKVAMEEDERERKRRQKQQQQQQQQGEGAGRGDVDAGPMTVQESDKHLQMLIQALRQLCSVQRWLIQGTARGSVFQPEGGAEELMAWRSGAVMAVEVLRALRVAGAPMRELIVGRLLVVEVAPGNIRKCVPPPAAAAAEAGKGGKGGAKASGKGSR